MEKVNFHGQKMNIMKENLFQIKLRDLEFITGLIKAYIKEIGLIFKWRGKVNLYGQTKVNILVDIKMV